LNFFLSSLFYQETLKNENKINRYFYLKTMSETINKSFFVSGTKIYTTNGHKTIEDVRIFDEVITNTGNIKKVIQVYTDCLDKNVHSLKVFKTPEIQTTENQLFLAIKWDDKTIQYSKPEWIVTDCLDENCFIKVPCKKHNLPDRTLLSSSLYRPTTPFNTPKIHPIQDPSYHDETNYRWTLNNDFFEFLGMFYGAGKIIERTIKKGTEYEGSINIKCPSYLVKKIVDFGSKLFKIPEIQIFNHRKKSNVKFVSNQLVSIFKPFEKTKLPYFFYSVSNECLKHFIYGWINTSGELTLKQEISSCLVPLNFAEELYHLFRSAGLCCELNTKKDNKKHGNVASLKFIRNNLDMSKFSKTYDDNRCFKFFRLINHTKNCLEIDGNLYLRVISNTLKFNTKSGYALEIEDEKSYAVEGLITKCF
jgi:hypothetical protein